MITKLCMKLAAGLMVSSVVVVGYILLKPSETISVALDTPIAQLPAELTPPDVVVATPKLAQLPEDFIKVPFFKQVLSEDAVDYYEHHPDRLGLEGTLRRMAFEHELQLQDHLISALLSEPAELAMWKTADGRPGRWVLRIEKNNLTAVMALVAKVALGDSQLSIDGAIGATPLYKLQYGSDQVLWFASSQHKLLILSDKHWLETRHGAAWSTVFSGLLGDGRNPLLQHYGVQAAGEINTVVANMRYLSLGYQRLFSSVKALRLDFGRHGWMSHVLLSQKTHWDGMPLWQSAPDGAALCLSAPVDWAMLKPVGDKAGIPSTWLAKLEPAAGICWYPNASLYSPLLLARTHDPEQFSRYAPKIFDWLIGASESALADENESRLPVRKNNQDGALLLQRAVSADDGSLRSDAQDAVMGVASLERPRYFDVSMAQSGSSIVFSPDFHLVATAMAVQQKRYAALADRIRGTHQGYVAPKALSQLLKAATMSTLPGQAQPLMQQAAVNYLLPHIAAIGEFPEAGLQLIPSTDHRQDLHWERLQWRIPK